MGSLLDTNWEPDFHRRRSEWLVLNLVYPAGGIGAVSRSYPDGRWRIVAEADAGPVLHGVRTFRTRTAAALAERELVLELYRAAVLADPGRYADLAEVEDEGDLEWWAWDHRTHLHGAWAFRDTFCAMKTTTGARA